MAGASGNAGLFSTASDLAIYCRMLLNGGSWKGRQILSPAAVAMLTTPQAHGRAYGFDVSSGYAWIKGPNASPAAFCHTGYTGTSLVCDPATGTYLILLTNSVHPHDKGTSKPIRQKTRGDRFPLAHRSGASLMSTRKRGHPAFRPNATRGSEPQKKIRMSPFPQTLRRGVCPKLGR